MPEPWWLPLSYYYEALAVPPRTLLTPCTQAVRPGYLPPAHTPCPATSKLFATAMESSDIHHLSMQPAPPSTTPAETANVPDGSSPIESIRNLYDTGVERSEVTGPPSGLGASRESEQTEAPEQNATIEALGSTGSRAVAHDLDVFAQTETRPEEEDWEGATVDGDSDSEGALVEFVDLLTLLTIPRDARVAIGGEPRSPPSWEQDSDPGSSVGSSRPEGIVDHLKSLGSSVLDTLESCASTFVEGASSVGKAISNTAVWQAGKSFLSSIGDVLNPFDAPHGENFAKGSILTSLSFLLPPVYQVPFFTGAMLSVAAGLNYLKRPSEVFENKRQQTRNNEASDSLDADDFLVLLQASLAAAIGGADPSLTLHSPRSHYRGDAGGFHTSNALF